MIKVVALLFALSWPISEGSAQTVPAFPQGAEAAEARLLTKVGTQTRAAIKQEAVKPKAEMDTRIDSMKNDLDSMSELGEAEQLRLQMAMDRLSKMMSTLSNLLKKISDTQSTLTQNLK